MENDIRAIIKEELLKYRLISDFTKNIEGIDSKLEMINERLAKLEDITDADSYQYVTETKLVKYERNR